MIQITITVDDRTAALARLQAADGVTLEEFLQRQFDVHVAQRLMAEFGDHVVVQALARAIVDAGVEQAAAVFADVQFVVDKYQALASVSPAKGQVTP
jgi:hypothetical protein